MGDRDDIGREPPTVVRLRPRLVPRPLWGLSGSNCIPNTAWRRIRAQTLAEAGSACAVCGSVRNRGMVCDEEWDYRDVDGVAILTGLRMLCPDCNGVTHFGHTQSAGYADVARAHMARVNRSPVDQVNAVIAAARAEWMIRSTNRWTIEVAPDLLGRHPEFATLVGRVGDPEGYGPNSPDVLALVARCRNLTRGELLALRSGARKKDRAVEDAGRSAFRAAREHERADQNSAARRAVVAAVESSLDHVRKRAPSRQSRLLRPIPAQAWIPLRAAHAMVVRDLVPPEVYETLTARWFEVIGAGPASPSG